MSSAEPHRLTKLLREWSAGDESAPARIAELAYPELHRIALRCFCNEPPGHTLQPTALVNEAFVRLVNLRQIQWNDRAHFFAVCARFMRRILVDYARSRPRCTRVALEEEFALSGEIDPDLVALDQALLSLAEFDPRQAQVVEMRFFGGLKANEIAAILGISAQSVHRDWSLAKAWLVRELRHDGSSTLGED